MKEYLCINPDCSNPQNLKQDMQNLECQSCGSNLLLQNRYLVVNLIRKNSGYSRIYTVIDQDKTAQEELKILKVLRSYYSKKNREIKKFSQEVDTLKKLNHPLLPKADSYFQHQLSNSKKMHCIVLQKIEGYNLEEWVTQNQPINQITALDWLEQIVNFLKYMHDNHYIHLDIKPHNIMLKNDGQLVLIDFGSTRKVTCIYKLYRATLAKLINLLFKGIKMDGFRAPEHNCRYCVYPSDFYALGRTFVYLLTGKNPQSQINFNADKQQLEWVQYASNVSEELVIVINKMMAEKLEFRYKNAQNILQDINVIKCK